MKKASMPRCIRPMIIENGDGEKRFSVDGLCFLVTHRNRLFALTAKHVVQGYLPEQYRIQNRLDSPNMLPVRRQIDNNFYCDENYEDVDFEDFVILEIDSPRIVARDFNPADACLIDESGIDWNAIQNVAVFGFPSEINGTNDAQGHIFIQPCGMMGHLIGGSCGEWMREIQFASVRDLTSYHGFSELERISIRKIKTLLLWHFSRFQLRLNHVHFGF